MSSRRHSRGLALAGVGAGVGALLVAFVILVTPGSASTSAAAPANATPPAITGAAAVGGILTASTGTWTGDGPFTFAYQWRSCDGGGDACTDLQGETGPTYTASTGDVGHTLRVAVKATDNAGATTAISAASTPVEAAQKPVNTAAPAIDGTPRQGETLTTSGGSWSALPPPALSYEWERCDKSGNLCATVDGQHARTYILSAADVAATIRSVVVASNAGGSSTATSAATGVVGTSGSSPHPGSQPDISGTDKVGQTLTAETGKTWTGTPPIGYSFFWQRCGSGGRCTTIAGATGRTYVATNADVGYRLRAIVTGRNDFGSNSIASNLTASGIAAIGPKPALRSAPTLTGSAQQGATLSATTGSWSSSASLQFGYAWSRCNGTGDACTTIAAATGSSYLLTTADVGHTLRVQVTATNSSGSASATSSPSAVVTALPAGLVRLPNGTISIPADSVELPQRLIVSHVTFSPNRLTSRAPFTGRFRVTDTRGYAVRDALVYAVALPYGVVRPAAETRTDADGWATIDFEPTAGVPRAGGAVVMFVRARNGSGRLLAGVSTRRLVQIRVAR